MSIGRVVHYTLSEGDARIIQTRRTDMILFGNQARAGDVYPAVVVRVFPGGTESNGVCNLQVLLDGPDTHWATSRVQGDTPGTWAWPARV